MSGPAGKSGNTPLASRINLARNSSSRASAGFSNLVHNLRQKHQDGEGRVDLPEDVKPSKGLPSTGLKKNTKEWKEKHGEEEEPGNDVDGERRRHSRASSSSSIPSDARSDAEAEREEDQEGALGDGPGRHERRIFENGEDGSGRYMESPTGEEPPADVNGNGLQDVGEKQQRATPPKEKTEEKSMIGGSANHVLGMKGAHAHRGGSKLPEHGTTPEKEADDGKELTYGSDPDQKVIHRGEDPYRRLTDEVGRYPAGLKGVKGEEPPGPRNEIVLDPRISHIHVCLHLALMLGDER